MAQILAKHTVSIVDLRRRVMAELACGAHQSAMVRMLVARGWPEVSATAFVANAALNALQTARSSPTKEALRKMAQAQQAQSRMLRGLMWTVAGVALTAISGDFAPLFGMLVVSATIGMIAFGTADFVAGLSHWLQAKQ